MSDAQSLLLVVAVIYVYECLAWVPRAATPLRAWWGNAFRPVNTSVSFGNEQGALAVKNPLPPLGQWLVTQSSPASFDAVGVLAYVAAAPNPGTRPPQTGRWVRYDTIESVETSGRDVFVNKSLFCKTASTDLASRTAELIQRLRKAKTADRNAIIDTALAAAFNRTAAGQRVAAWREQSAMLVGVACALFLHVFVVIPYVVSRHGLVSHWAWLLVVLVALQWMCIVEYYYAHRVLYPAATSERRGHVMTMILFPPATLRAHDSLARNVLSEFHPLVAAHAVCDSAAFQDYAAAVWRDMRQPIEPVCPSETPEAAAAERWFRGRIETHIAGLLREAGLEPATLDAAPTPDSAESRTYCPRCHSQFVLEAGTCHSCGKIVLLNLPPRAALTRSV